MAGITQTIPSFIQGISEQADHLKFQGQVRDIVNAIPDPTFGLFKRPGGARVGTAPLSSVQNGGSWFHYFRDESEGSYIGQVAPNGLVTVWSCSTGTATTTAYGAASWQSVNDYAVGDKVSANSKIYKAQAAISSGGSAPSHSSGTTNNWLFVETIATAQTRIQNYLTTSESENLQFLTINDTTFVNNRDNSDARKQYTTVGESGSTPDRPEAHCAMIELLRTENGRQYGINIYDSTATSSNLTTVKRATKVKITGNNYDEGDGSGHCPGIGTEVYAVTAKSSYGATENIVHVKNSGGTVQTESSNKNNLTFRVTALGQQGVSPNYNASSNGPGGNNYRCSYNLEVVLLHGGEGWDVGDVIRVEPEHASEASSSDSQAYIEVSVTEIETTQVKATLTNNGDGLVRPSPTPFDADTAVTADTILAGIIDLLPSGINAKVIGPGIYLSSSSPFNIEIAEEDLMRVFQKTVNDVTLLPNQCRHGYVVKVANARMSDEDDYYLRFSGENNLDGAGSWSECPLPGITDTLTNMPLVIQRTGTTTSIEFTVREFDFEVRRVGDTKTNPMPTFVGKPINKILFFRNRLAFLAGENVILSRPGTLGRPDFFIESALTVSASDPIDISAASMFPSDLFDGLQINAGLLVFSSNQQFLLSSDDTVLNPDTAKLRSVSTFNYNKDIPPISLGTTVAYLDNSGKFSRMNQMANTGREGEPSIVEISKLVPTLLPKDLDLLTNSRENSMILIGKTDSDTVFGYKYLQVGEKVQQQAWFKWKFNNPLKYHFIINDEYYYLDTDNFLQCLKLIQTDTDPDIDKDGVNYLIHLDNHTTISGGNHDPSTGLTTFSNVSWLSSVTTPNGQLVVIDDDGNDQGRYGECTKTSTTTFTVPGDWSGLTVNVGYLYEYLVEFPQLYPTKMDGERSVSDVNSSLVLHRLKLHFGKIGLYATKLERVGKPDYTEVYESPIPDIYKASRAPYLEEHIQTVPVYERNTNVEITLTSSHPAPATLRAMSWEGDFSPRFYKRV